MPANIVNLKREREQMNTVVIVILILLEKEI